MTEDPYDNGPTHEPFDSDDDLADGIDAPPPQPAVPASRVVYCTSCGVQLDGLMIGQPCPNCQVPVGSAAQGGAKTNGKAIASLVLGICSFVGCLLYGLPGIVCAILAIVFGGQVKRGVEAGEMNAASLGPANAGRICGIIGLCLSIVYMLAAIAWFVFLFAFMIPQQQQQQNQPPTMQPPMQPTPVPQPPAQPTPPTPATNP